jgi:hypothetical protein
VLILSNFTGGGGTPLVQVYEWMNGGLTLVDSWELLQHSRLR